MTKISSHTTNHKKPPFLGIALDRRELARHLRSSRTRRDESKNVVETRLTQVLEREKAQSRSGASPDFLSLVIDGVASLEADEGGVVELLPAELDIISESYGISSLILQSLRSKPHNRLCLTHSLKQFVPTAKKFGKNADYFVPSAKIVGTEDVQIVYATILPGGRSDTHAHPGEELLFVLEGEIETRLENSGFWTRLGKGEYIHFYSEQVHTVHNISSQLARIFIIRCYQFEWSGVRQWLKKLNVEKPPRNLVRRVLYEMKGSLRFDMRVQTKPADAVIDRFGFGRLLKKLCAERFRGEGNHLRVKDLAERGRPYDINQSKIDRMHNGLALVTSEELTIIAQLYDVEPFLFYDFLFPAFRNAVVVRPPDDMSLVHDDFNPSSEARYYVPIRRLAESDVAIAVLELPPHTSSPMNGHPGYELLLPLSGGVVLHLADEIIPIVVDEHLFAHFASDQQHRVANEDSEPASVLVVRFYE